MGTYAYDSTNDELIPIAGQGKAEYGASTVRTGTFTGTDGGTGLINITVTFDSPMPDADYLVDITDVSSVENFWVSVAAKTKNGFALYLRKSTGGSSITVNGTYTAFKLYTDTEYNNLLNNAVLTSDVTDAVTNGDMNPVTSNAVYDTLATTSVSIEKTTVAGLTTSWGDNAPASHIAYRVGNLVVMNVNLSITGTYSGTTGWVNLWNMPYSLIKTGEALNVPYMVNIGRNASGNVITILNGSALYIENGQSLTLGATGQIICTISS